MRRSPCGVCRSMSSLCASYRRARAEVRDALRDPGPALNADPMGEVTIEVPEEVVDPMATVVAVDVRE